MPLLPITAELDRLLEAAFERAGIPTEFARSTPSSRPDLADWQCNGALAAARAVGRPPREIAEVVAAQLRGMDQFRSVDVAGPGFINLVLSDRFLWAAVDEMLSTDRLGLPDAGEDGPVVIDFGGPNIAKPLHVGHLRSLLIGESIRRTLVALGHQVTSDAHLGDWGLQMGMLVSEIEEEMPELPYFRTDGPQDWPDHPPFDIAGMEALYTRAAARCKGDETRLEAARRATAALQAGHPGYLELWRQMRELSIEAVRSTIAELDAHFDLMEGESDVADLIDPMVRDLEASGAAVESEGALVIRLDPDPDSPTPPLLLKKADGAALYSTTDLATIVSRYRRFRPGRIVYVVDARQSLHFEQLFRAAALVEAAPGTELVHIGFGTVNGKDNRPYKTREGGVMRLDDLLAEAIAKARDRIAESEQISGYDDEERERLARQIGISAVKYADLSSFRMSGYVFDVDRLVSFEGKTGPYLQYACVRLKSLLDKAGAEADLDPARPRLDPEARAVVLECLQFPETVMAAARDYAPNQIAEHAYTIAQKFSRFYTNCPILHEKDEDLRQSRLKVVKSVYAVLSRELWLLGLAVPARM